jgi:uncharacterized protein (TIGR03067 family)
MMLLTMAAAGAEDASEAIEKDRKLIAGKWRVVALEVNGSKATDRDARKLSVVNGDDGTWTLFSEGKEIAKGTSTFDPAQTPKTIDFTPTQGGGAGSVHLGIYELGEKTRKLCFAPPGKGRPVAFAAPSGSGHILVMFEREE